MSADWYYLKGDKKFGPVSLEELQTLAESGKLAPTDMLWKEGQSEWRSAVKFKPLKGLFGAEINPSRSTAQVQMDSAKKLWNRAGAMAEQVGRIASDAVSPGGFDEYAKLTGNSESPAIFLQAEFFGGRTRIGASIESLNTLGARIGTALFSWPYIVIFLRSLSSAWEFLPFTRTEFVRITLEQKIMWKRVSSAFIAWLITMMVFMILALVAATFAAGIMKFLGDTLGAFASLLVPLLIFGGYIAANLLAWNMLVGLKDDDLHRSRIILEYGFPRKYRLLSGLSDAPVENQIDGVLKLCEALSKTQFSQWDQFSNHGDGDGLLRATFNKISRFG
jgi:hypothetical protein